jgi:hypothetical protein
MNQPKKKPEKKVCLVGDEMPLVLPTIDDIRMEEWRCRTSICSAIRLGFSYMARASKFHDAWKREHGKEYHTPTLKYIQPSCTLSTKLLADMCRKLMTIASPYVTDENFSTRAMCVSIVHSCNCGMKAYSELSRMKSLISEEEGQRRYIQDPD